MTHLHGQRLDQNTMNQRCGPVPCVEMVEQLVLLTHSVLVGFGSGLITSKWNNNVGIAWHGSSFRSYDPDAPRLGAETLSPQSTHHGCVLESSFQDLFLLVAPVATQIEKQSACWTLVREDFSMKIMLQLQCLMQLVWVIIKNHVASLGMMLYLRLTNDTHQRFVRTWPR